MKTISLMFETETVGPFLVQMLKLSGNDPLALSEGTPLIDDCAKSMKAKN